MQRVTSPWDRRLRPKTNILHTGNEIWALLEYRLRQHRYWRKGCGSRNNSTLQPVVPEVIFTTHFRSSVASSIQPLASRVQEEHISVHNSHNKPQMARESRIEDEWTLVTSIGMKLKLDIVRL